MKNFLDQVRDSIYSKTFYKNLKDKKTSFTIYYLIKLSLVIALLASIFSIIGIFTMQKIVLNEAGVKDVGSIAIKYIEEFYKDDLKIVLNDNSLTTNSNEPIFFPIPYNWFDIDFDDKLELMQNFIVISPNEKSDLDLIEKYDSLLFLSSTSLAYLDPNTNSIQTHEYKDISEEIGTRTLDKVKALEIANDIKSGVNSFIIFIYPILAILIFIFSTIFIFVGTLITSIFGALFVWIIGKIMKLKDDYGEWYLKVIHAQTLYIVLSWTIGWLIPFGIIPFSGLIFTFLVLYLNDNFKK